MAKFLVGAPSDMANQWYTSRGALKKQLAPMNGAVIPYPVSGTAQFSIEESLVLLTYGAFRVPAYKNDFVIQKNNKAYSFYDSRLAEPKSYVSVKNTPGSQETYLKLPGNVKKPLLLAAAISVSNSLDFNGFPCNITNDGQNPYENYGAIGYTSLIEDYLSTDTLCFDIPDFFSSKKTVSFSLPVNGQDQLFEFNLLSPSTNKKLAVCNYTVPSYGAVGVNTNKTVFAYVTSCVKAKNSFVINFKTSKTNKLCIGATLNTDFGAHKASSAFAISLMPQDLELIGSGGDFEIKIEFPSEDVCPTLPTEGDLLTLGTYSMFGYFSDEEHSSVVNGLLYDFAVADYTIQQGQEEATINASISTIVDGYPKNMYYVDAQSADGTFDHYFIMA